MQTPTKFCPDCKETKERTEFYLRRKSGQTSCSRCKVCHLKYTKEHELEKFGSHKYRHMFQNHGLTAEAYDEMYEKQQGRCFLCERERKLVIDHCHTTGRVRGLLCNGCNIGLGQFEYLMLFDKAKEYVTSKPPH